MFAVFLFLFLLLFLLMFVAAHFLYLCEGVKASKSTAQRSNSRMQQQRW
jgi:hypothetical protein